MAGPTLDRNPVRGSHTNLTPEFGTFVVHAPEAVRGVRLLLRMPVETIGREGSLKLVSATVSRSHARVWTADSRQPTADSRQPTADSRQPSLHRGCRLRQRHPCQRQAIDQETPPG
jgi:hypothetical protein